MFGLITAIGEFLEEIKTMRKEHKDVADIVASQDKRIEKLEKVFENG